MTQNCSPATIASMVQANPSLVPNIKYITDMFPGVANAFFKGSTAANYFYGIYGDLQRQLSGHAALQRTGFPASTPPPALAPQNSAATRSSLRKAVRCPLG